MNMRKLTAVARREYVETVKTKAFLFGILLMPGIIVGMIFLSAKMSMPGQRTEGPIRVAVLDRTDRVAAEMTRLAERRQATGSGQVVEMETVPSADSARDELEPFKSRVRDGSLSGLLEVPAEALQGKGTCELHILSAGMDDRARQIRQLFNQALTHIRLADVGYDPQRVEQLSRPIEIRQQDIGRQQGGRSDSMSSVMTPFAFVFLMFMGVFGVSQGLLTSVIEEKSSRVVEVLLSALSPFELMAGKILGMAAVGLTMVLLWSAVGYAAAVSQHVQHLVQISNLGQFILYYGLGYLLISSLLAAVGSACNTLKEAQPMLTPLMLVLVVPMMFWMQIVNAPNSAQSVALSLIPPMTPFVMILRLASPVAEVPVWQQVLTPIWLAAWVLAAMWAASRVFRVGILMYGKPPGLRELAKWVRY